MEYIFCAQYISDIKQIQSDANMAIWLSRGRTLDGSLITAGTFHNPDAIKQLVRNQEAYKFLKNVRGSPSYWQSELYDVLAMLRIIGIPTFLSYSFGCRPPLARNDPSSCITTWKENVS